MNSLTLVAVTGDRHVALLLAKTYVEKFPSESKFFFIMTYVIGFPAIPL